MEDLFKKMNDCRLNGECYVTATVIEKVGMGPADVGKKIFVSENGDILGTVGGGAVEHYAINKCKELLLTRQSLLEKYNLDDSNNVTGYISLPMACGGQVSLFYEFFGPKQSVYIFGGGHCGAALAKILMYLNFFVTIIDNREEVINKVSANKIHISKALNFLKTEKLKKGSYVVVCTPSHEYDYEILDALIESKPDISYFGMLCSKKKINEYLSKAYEKYGKDIDLSKLYAPIGLNIGGTSPEEIAISIVSEILSIHYQKDKENSHLREANKTNRYWEK